MSDIEQDLRILQRTVDKPTLRAQARRTLLLVTDLKYAVMRYSGAWDGKESPQASAAIACIGASNAAMWQHIEELLGGSLSQ